MIYLKRSGSALTVGSGDLAHLEYVAASALDRGETVELQIDGQPWQVVDSPAEVSDTLHDLYEVLDARRDALTDQDQLPLEDAL